VGKGEACSILRRSCGSLVPTDQGKGRFKKKVTRVTFSLIQGACFGAGGEEISRQRGSLGKDSFSRAGKGGSGPFEEGSKITQ